jgi:hypothetical protein
MLALQQRVFCVVAMTKLSAGCSVRRSIGFYEHGTDPRTSLVVGSRLVDGLPHHLDGFLHHLARIELGLGEHGRGSFDLLNGNQIGINAGEAGDADGGNSSGSRQAGGGRQHTTVVVLVRVVMVPTHVIVINVVILLGVLLLLFLLLLLVLLLLLTALNMMMPSFFGCTPDCTPPHLHWRAERAANQSTSRPASRVSGGDRCGPARRSAVKEALCPTASPRPCPPKFLRGSAGGSQDHSIAAASTMDSLRLMVSCPRCA